MKLTKSQLKRIIKEELASFQKERRHVKQILISRQEFQTLKEYKIPIPENVLVREQRPINEVGPAIAGAVRGAAAVGSVGARVASSETAKKIGGELFMDLMSSTEGRNKLADLIISITDLPKVMCEIWNAPAWAGGKVDNLAGTGSTEEPGPLSRISSSFSASAKKLCQHGWALTAKPLHLLAYAIRGLDDEQAKIVTGQTEEE